MNNAEIRPGTFLRTPATGVKLRVNEVLVRVNTAMPKSVSCILWCVIVEQGTGTSAVGSTVSIDMDNLENPIKDNRIRVERQ
jgi:hypothetical protein